MPMWWTLSTAQRTSSNTAMPEGVVIDASAMVDLLVGSPVAAAVAERLRGQELHAPAHFDAEVLSALGRLNRAGHIGDDETEARIDRLAGAPIERHSLAKLVSGAWQRRHNLRLVDALYVELACLLEVRIVTTDGGLAVACGVADLV